VPGEWVRLVDAKGRRHNICLESGASFHTNRGAILHDDLIGRDEGFTVTSSSGGEYLVFRPMLNEFVVSMPRGAAVVYPKDAAQIVAMADIFPGAHVVEAGVGSGALTCSLLRAVGPHGRVSSFERREEFADVARDNAATFLGADPDNWTVTVGDLQEALPAAVEPGTVDRVVLDMLAPWETLDVVTQALKPGGVVLCYVATVTQLSRVAEAIRATGHYTHPQSNETMVRGWHVEGLAVRPDHRMIAHTGFLITARRLAPDTVLPELKRRPSKSDYSEEDVEAWTPGALGERQSSPKSLRKRMREAAASADLAKAREGAPTGDAADEDAPTVD
jgi:tRNA (adenine57-N1/adenine58-N1)-methyltransferase